MDPTNKPMKVTLKGKEYTLYFDLNTFSAFEDVTGRFFLDFLVEIQESLAAAFSSKGEGEGSPLSLQFLRKIPAKQVKAFLWAALHTYDREGEPSWPMTLGQLGAIVDYQAIIELVPALLSGAQPNLPKRKEEKEEGSNPIEVEGSLLETGGNPLGPSEDDVLALLESK